MARQQLDNLDYKILNMLSDNARKAFLEIARETNVSGAAIHQRVQKLTQFAINGFETIVDPAILGYETCAYIGFILKEASAFKDIIDHLRNIPEVVECHITSGQYDILAKIYARNNTHLMELIHNHINSEGMARTETLISFEQVFRRPIPVNIPE